MEDYQALEAEFGQWMGYKPEQMVACSSGSAALHLALEAMDCGLMIAIPDFSMVACARAVSLANKRPKFIDCDNQLNIDLSRIDSFTTAVMPVHIYGRRAFGVELLESSLYVIEDMAEAHGVKPSKRTDAACWSFYKNKIVAGEEGGMVAFKDVKDADLARQLRSHGFTPDHDFRHIPRGMNYRLSNVHARLIRQSLACVNENIEDRNTLENYYDNAVAAWNPDYLMPPRDVVWVYDLRIPGMTHDRQRALVRDLNAKGVAARCAFYPLSKQVEYTHLGFECPNSFRLSSEVIYLPVNPIMTSDDVQRNVNILKQSVSMPSSK